MKILLVTPEWGAVAGGIATYYRNLVPQLRALGHQVDVRVGSAFTLASGQAVEPGVAWLPAVELEKHLDRFRHLNLFSQLDRHLAAAWGLRDMAPFDQYDVVECCDWGLSFLPWLETRAKVVVRLHASLGQIARHEMLPGQAAFQTAVALLEQASLAHADGLVTYARANAHDWSARLGTEVALQRPPYVAGQIAGGGGAGIVSGKIQRWKGVEILCQALAQVEGLELDWYGNDMPTEVDGARVSMSASLKQRFPGVWGRCLKPRGVVYPEQLAALRQAASFVVVPSTWDVFNFTVVEAMADGLPVIVSRGAGASELIEHGGNGLLFDAGDVAGLVACLEQFKLLTATQRSAMGAAARATVQQRLDPANVAREHATYFQSISARPARERDGRSLQEILTCPANCAGSNDLLENVAGKSLVAALWRRASARFGGAA